MCQAIQPASSFHLDGENDSALALAASSLQSLAADHIFKSSLFAEVLVLHVLDFLQKLKDVGNRQSCFSNIFLSHFILQSSSAKLQKSSELVFQSHNCFTSWFDFILFESVSSFLRAVQRAI